MIQFEGKLFQWDVNRSVSTDAPQVHFACPGDSEALVVKAVDRHAAIPNQLLARGCDIYSWEQGEDGNTASAKCLSVTRRAKPSGYIYTPSEVESFASLTQAVLDELADLQSKVDSGYFKGGRGEPGPQGAKGETGPQGPKGDKGDPGTADWNALENKPFDKPSAGTFYVDGSKQLQIKPAAILSSHIAEKAIDSTKLEGSTASVPADNTAYVMGIGGKLYNAAHSALFTYIKNKLSALSSWITTDMLADGAVGGAKTQAAQAVPGGSTVDASIPYRGTVALMNGNCHVRPMTSGVAYVSTFTNDAMFVQDATSSRKGCVMPDNTTITVNNGTLSVNTQPLHDYIDEQLGVIENGAY